jgi:hypothetical protein
MPPGRNSAKPSAIVSRIKPTRAGPRASRRRRLNPITNFKAANPDGDSSLDRNEFSAACKSGLVKGTASTGAATGEPSDKMAPAEKMAPKKY